MLWLKLLVYYLTLTITGLLVRTHTQYYDIRLLSIVKECEYKNSNRI